MRRMLVQPRREPLPRGYRTFEIIVWLCITAGVIAFVTHGVLWGSW